MKNFIRVLWWCWFFPCLILINGYYLITEYASFIFHAPIKAWEVATEAANEL